MEESDGSATNNNDDDDDDDTETRLQQEGQSLLFAACSKHWLGAQAAAEEAAAMGAAGAAAAAATEAAAAATGGATPTFPPNNLPLAAAMMLDRWSLLLHPDRPSCITPTMLARKALLLHKGSESPSLRQEIKEELLGRRMQEAQAEGDRLDNGQPEPAPSLPPHIYAIPFPATAARLLRAAPASSPSPPPPPPSAPPPPLLPFSQSHVYQASRAFYSRNAERAWISTVPFGVTTNAKLADSYAQVLLAYLRDLEEADEEADEEDEEEGEGESGWEGRRAVHIVEVAAGHGLFGFLLAKRLRELLQHRRERERERERERPGVRWRPRLVMTDFNGELLASRRSAPWLRPFVGDGSVDFAVLDASVDASVGEGEQGLQLLSGAVLRPASLRGPLVVLGNYALDSLPCDVYFQFPSSTSSSSSSNSGRRRRRRREGSEGGGWGRTGAEEGGPEEMEQDDDEEAVVVEAGSAVHELLVNPATRRYHLSEPLSPARLDALPHAGLLRAMLARGREGLHVVNTGFLRVLARLRGLLHPANDGIAVLVGDGAFQHDDDHWLVEATAAARPQGAPRPPLPDMSPDPGSGCFALAVDAQALALAVRWAFQRGPGEQEDEDEDEGWLAIRNTEVESSLTVSFVARRPRSAPHLQRTVAVFWRRLCLESPTDIEQLGGLLQQEVEEEAGTGTGGGGGGVSHSGRRTLLGRLGLQGLRGLLAWSNHDADLFASLMWTLRAHLVAQQQQQQQQQQQEKEQAQEQQLQARAAVLSTAFRCLGNRLALGEKAWCYTRLMGMRFFYALGEPRWALAFFLHDAGLLPLPLFTPSPPALPPPLPTMWDRAYEAAFGRAAEAFLVVRCLAALDGRRQEGPGDENETGARYEYPSAVRRAILERALGDARRLRDGKGRRRIEKALKEKKK